MRRLLFLAEAGVDPVEVAAVVEGLLGPQLVDGVQGYYVNTSAASNKLLVELVLETVEVGATMEAALTGSIAKLLPRAVGA